MSEVTVPNYGDIYLTAAPTPDYPAQVNRSAWTGKSKVVGLPGAEKWMARFAFYGLESELDERPWRAFFAKLKGVENWFRLRVACQTPRGSNPLVAAGAGTGYTLPVKGMLPFAIHLEAGQYMTVLLPSGHYRCVCLTEHLIADAAGNATAQFSPALNEAPAVDVVIETGRPFIPVRFKEVPAIGYSGSIGTGDYEVEEI